MPMVANGRPVTEIDSAAVVTVAVFLGAVLFFLTLDGELHLALGGQSLGGLAILRGTLEIVILLQPDVGRPRTT